MNPIHGETILFESDPKGFTLTTHRIRWQAAGVGNAQVKSMMLEELASCSIEQSSNPLLLALAGLSFIIGIVIASGGRADAGPFAIGLVVAIILVAIYLGTRRQVLLLQSAGASIRTDVKGTNVQDSIDIVDRIESAKNARYLIGKRQ